jgi:hypothetical protein
MKTLGKAKRRWLGGIALGLAAVMLLLGETLLKGRLTQGGFVMYWMICFALTLIAIMVAVMDVRSLQQSVSRETRDLLEDTLKTIEKEARDRKRQ